MSAPTQEPRAEYLARAKARLAELDDDDVISRDELVQGIARAEAEIDPSKPTREFLALSDGSFLLCGDGWRLEVDHLRRERHQLVGEVAMVVPEREGQPEFRSTGTVNLSSVRSRKEYAGYLKDLAATFDFDFLPLVEELSERVLAAERKGQPAIVLRDVPRPTAASTIVVDGFTLAREHPIIPFGDGGTGKSLLALWVETKLEALGIRTLYCDWELSEDEHRLRLEQLCGPEMPEIRYARCDRPLTAEVDRLARLVRDNGIGYVVIDSIAPACDGAPEAAEAATGFFRALRQLRVGSLCLAHTNRSETADKKPFGSTFWHNLARMTWYVEAEQGGGPGHLTIALHNRKSNLGPLLPSIGYDLHFVDDRITVQRVDVATVAELADKMPLWQHMVAALRGGPMTIAALAEATGGKPDTIDRTVRRSRNLFVRTSSANGDGIARIALIERGKR